MMALATVLSIALVAATAPDGGTAAARRWSDEGKLLYELGRFDEAQHSYERAYAAKPLPAFLFNIGQCHFQARRFERAAFFYELYLDLEPEAPNRDVVEELVAEARHTLELERQTRAVPTLGAPPPVPAPPVAPTPAPMPAPAVAAAVVGAPAPPAAGPGPQAPTPGVAEEVPWGVWVGVTGGAVAAVAGGALLLWVWGNGAATTPTSDLGVLDRTGS